MWSWRLVLILLESWTSTITFLLPLRLLSTHIRCSWKRGEGGKVRYRERLYIVSSTDIQRCKGMHLVIIVLSPVFTFGVHDTAPSVHFPLFPLCVCFEFDPDNPFYPLSSVKLPIFVCWTSLLHTTLVRSFAVLLSQIFDRLVHFFKWMKMDDAKPETLVVRGVPFTNALFLSVSGTRSLHIKKTLVL